MTSAQVLGQASQHHDVCCCWGDGSTGAGAWGARSFPVISVIPQKEVAFVAAWGGPGLRREVPAAARSLEPPPQKHHPKSFVLCHGDDDPWGV